MTDIRATTSQDPQSAGTAILGGGAASLASRPELMPAHALKGDPVVNPKGYALGTVEHIVIDVQRVHLRSRSLRWRPRPMQHCW